MQFPTTLMDKAEKLTKAHYITKSYMMILNDVKTSKCLE